MWKNVKRKKISEMHVWFSYITKLDMETIEWIIISFFYVLCFFDVIYD